MRPLYSRPKILVNAFGLLYTFLMRVFRGPVASDRGGFQGFAPRGGLKTPLDETAPPGHSASLGSVDRRCMSLVIMKSGSMRSGTAPAARPRATPHPRFRVRPVC